MKILGKIVLVLFCICAALAGGAAGGYYAARHVLLAADGERAEAQATFTAPDEATVEFPALVRGRRINCMVWLSTKRKALSVMC